MVDLGHDRGRPSAHRPCPYCAGGPGYTDVVNGTPNTYPAQYHHALLKQWLTVNFGSAGYNKDNDFTLAVRNSPIHNATRAILPRWTTIMRQQHPELRGIGNFDWSKIS